MTHPKISRKTAAGTTTVAEQEHFLPREIATERLSLRPFSCADAGDVADYANDEEWSRFLPAPYPYSRRDAEMFVARAVLGDWRTSPGWAVVLEERVIGGIGLRLSGEDHLAEIAWNLASLHWGKGLTTEAARAVIDRAFTAIPVLARVSARADASNHASIRVMQKVGMAHEATLRSNRFWKGEVVDEVYYGVLREEWAGRR